MFSKLGQGEEFNCELVVVSGCRSSEAAVRVNNRLGGRKREGRLLGGERGAANKVDVGFGTQKVVRSIRERRRERARRQPKFIGPFVPSPEKCARTNVTFGDLAAAATTCGAAS